MNTVDTDHLEDAHLAQWLKTSHHYLLGDQKKIVNVTEKALLDAKLDSHGAQDRFLSRARGSLLRLCAAAQDRHCSRHSRRQWKAPWIGAQQLFADMDVTVALLDAPAGDRFQCGCAKCVACAQAEAGVVPRTAYRVAHQ